MCCAWAPPAGTPSPAPWVLLEGEIQVAQLSRMGGEPGFVDWKPETPVTAPAPQDVPVLSVEPGAPTSPSLCPPCRRFLRT